MSEAYELSMPFVNVASVGGKFDDEPFVAGFEMGLLEARLNLAALITATSIDATIRTDNVEQADRIAMSHGFVVTDTVDHGEWTCIRFVPATEVGT